METREEKQQGRLITRKEKNKLSWQTIALPHIVHHALRAHTHMIYNTPTQHCQWQAGESEREACKVDPVH